MLLPTSLNALNGLAGIGVGLGALEWLGKGQEQQHMPVDLADKVFTLNIRYSGHFCIERNHSSLANTPVPCFSLQTTNFRDRQFPIRKGES